jgi:hypothetical protein
MANYRMELWFNFDDTTAGWGVVRHPDNGSKRAVMTASDGVVDIDDGSASSLDIQVFDASSSGTHSLDYLNVDFEIASDPQPGQTNKDPVADAPALRAGETGTQFSSAGNSNDQVIYSYPGGQRNALQGWNSRNNFESLTAGNYSFTVTIKSTPAGGTQQTFTIDPELDIDSGNP